MHTANGKNTENIDDMRKMSETHLSTYLNIHHFIKKFSYSCNVHVICSECAVSVIYLLTLWLTIKKKIYKVLDLLQVWLIAF